MFVGVDRDSGVITGILTACVIVIADGIWKSMSSDLTNWENHHTSKAFEDSLIIKRFTFQFVSSKSFWSFFPCFEVVKSMKTNDIPTCI